MARGADLRYDLTLSFEEAAFGTGTTLRIPRLETCGKCTGSGSANGAAPTTCSACGGRGQVRFTQGFFTVARTCPQCQGEGRVVTIVQRVRGEGGREGALDRGEIRRAGWTPAPHAPSAGASTAATAAGATSTVLQCAAQALPPRRRDGSCAHAISYAGVMGTSIEVETLRGNAR